VLGVGCGVWLGVKYEKDARVYLNKSADPLISHTPHPTSYTLSSTPNPLHSILFADLFMPTARTPAMHRFSFIGLVIGGARQATNYFALIIIKLIPCFEPFLAALRASPAHIHRSSFLVTRVVQPQTDSLRYSLTTTRPRDKRDKN
jgi:hypothetical protein